MKLITSNEELAKAVNIISKEKYLAIDTEFHRESSYYPVLALMQIYAKEHDELYLIDTLADLDLTSLFKIIYDENIVKVFHSARQDLEILYNIHQQLPPNIFDTQIAASVLGFGEMVSYVNIVYEICQIKLKKDLRQSNWMHRPLSNKQLEYAASDVKYLADIYIYLVDELTKQQRLEWISEEMAKLISEDEYQVSTMAIARKLMPSSSSNKFFTRLFYLVEWREKLAMQQNMPRQHILKDSLLLELAANDKDKINIQRVRNFKQFTNQKKYMQLLQNDWPLFTDEQKILKAPKSNYQAKKNNNLYDILKLLLKITADQNNVAEKIICTTSDLNIIANTETKDLNSLDLPIFKGWRKEIFGDLLIKFRQGKLSISIQDYDIKFNDI